MSRGYSSVYLLAHDWPEKKYKSPSCPTGLIFSTDQNIRSGGLFLSVTCDHRGWHFEHRQFQWPQLQFGFVRLLKVSSGRQIDLEDIQRAVKSEGLPNTLDVFRGKMDWALCMIKRLVDEDLIRLRKGWTRGRLCEELEEFIWGISETDVDLFGPGTKEWAAIASSRYLC